MERKSIFSKVSLFPRGLRGKDNLRGEAETLEKMDFGAFLESVMNERDLRRFVKNNWSGWLDWIEPRGNAGVGHPDMELLVDGVVALVELKIGSMPAGQLRFKIDKMRPDQISWHHNFQRFGGRAFFLIAESESSMWVTSRLIYSDKPYYSFWYITKIGSSFTKDVSEAIRIGRAP